MLQRWGLIVPIFDLVAAIISFKSCNMQQKSVFILKWPFWDMKGLFMELFYATEE